jgi:hypothetical protein
MMRRLALATTISLLTLSAVVGCTLTTTSEPTPIPRPTVPGFQGQQVATPFPTLPPPVLSTPIIITITPIGLNDPITPPIDTDLPDPQPGEQTENIVEALINRVLIPAWNFLYTFITGSIISLWDFAGMRGGMMAQTLFCLIPGIVVTLGVLWRVFRRRR